MCKCHKCSVQVFDGVNGEVSPPAPWEAADAEPIVECYACQNEAEMAGDAQHMEEQIEAAMRVGRFDLL